MVEVRFRTELGVEVLVPVPGTTAVEVRDAVQRALREYSRLGWSAIPIPAGGLRFPLANEPDFDWRLLGARRGKGMVDGEEREGVWHGGQFYTRRELAANPRRKLGPAIKYSRVAKGSDSSELAEEGDGGFRYVTLAVFRGDGRKRDEYAVPAPEQSVSERRGRVASTQSR